MPNKATFTDSGVMISIFFWGSTTQPTTGHDDTGITVAYGAACPAQWRTITMFNKIVLKYKFGTKVRNKVIIKGEVCLFS